MRFVVFWKTDENILRRAVLRVRTAVTTGKGRTKVRKIIADSAYCRWTHVHKFFRFAELRAWSLWETHITSSMPRSHESPSIVVIRISEEQPSPFSCPRALHLPCTGIPTLGISLDLKARHYEDVIEEILLVDHTLQSY